MIVYENPWFRVIRNGKYYFVDEPRAREAAVIFLEWRDRIALVRQHRAGADRTMLEAPRGYGEPGETSAQCAVREGYEETGFRVAPEDAEFLGYVHPNSAILSTKVAAYFARASSPQEQGWRSEEVDRCELMTREQIRAQIASNEITDGFTISGFFLLTLHSDF